MKEEGGVMHYMYVHTHTHTHTHAMRLYSRLERGKKDISEKAQKYCSLYARM